MALGPQSGLAVGIYGNNVEDLWFRCVGPQWAGNRTDILGVSFTYDQRLGLRYIGMPLLNFSA